MKERGSMRRILSVFFPDFQRVLGQEKSAESALVNLAQWAYRFSPIVAPDTRPADMEEDARFFGINLDITGCERLFNGEENIVKKLSESLSRFRLEHKIVISPSLGASWALSRYGKAKVRIISRAALQAEVLLLPVECLRVRQKVIGELHELNVRTVQELLKLPRKSLLERFGRQLLERLDQLLGLQQEPINPIRIVTLARAVKSFDGAVVEKETLKSASWEMLEELLEKLKQRSVKPSQLLIRAETVSGRSVVKELTLTLPTYSRKHLFRMIGHKLDTLSAEPGVEKLILVANRTEQFSPTAGEFLSLRSTDHEGERQLSELLDTLITTLGREQLLVPEFQESHLPERVLRLKSFAGPVEKKHVERKQTPSLPRTDRPSLLLNKPQPIRAMATMPDGAPFLVKWREQKYEVREAIGPERISGEWWRSGSSSSRDYFKIKLPNGTWLWIFRELESSRWYLQGLWA
jgi:protein ImuB